MVCVIGLVDVVIIVGLVGLVGWSLWLSEGDQSDYGMVKWRDMFKSKLSRGDKAIIHQMGARTPRSNQSDAEIRSAIDTILGLPPGIGELVSAI